MSVKKIITSLILSAFFSATLWAQVNNVSWMANDQSVGFDRENHISEKISPLNLPEVLALCEGEEGEVEIAGKFKEIRWNTGAKTNYITVQDTGLYTVEVFDGNHWIKDSIRVIKYSELKAKPTQTHILCEGSALKLTGNIDAVAWNWNNASSKWGLSISKPGDYFVTSFNECYSVTDTFHVVKSSTAGPKVFFEEISTCLKNNIPLSAFGPAENYRWSTGQQSQNILVNTGGEYTVTFAVCDSIYMQTFTVDVKARSSNPIYFPNVFTPNADNINDNFKMVGASDQITDFSISIFNRWGILLYRSNDPNFEWNGHYKGSVVPDGVYFYGGGYRHNCSGDQFIPIEGSITTHQ